MPSSGEREELARAIDGRGWDAGFIEREPVAAEALRKNWLAVADRLIGLGYRRAPAWRPISEAPRDGTEILGGTVGSGNIEFYRWNEEESLWLSRGDYYQPTKALTHWQPLEPPLPLPPEEE